MKRLLFAMCAFSMLQASSIKVAVSANVSYAIGDLKKEFLSSHPNTKIDTIVASTGKLTTQIIHGAPYDMLLGANVQYPQKLYDMHIAITKPVVYAKGALIYLSSKNYDLSHPIELLASSKIKRIAIANPKTAPYGMASVEALKHAKVFDKIKSKFIYGESISQTLTYTLKASDIGIVAKSSIYSPKLSYLKKSNYKDVNSSLYTPISQAMVLLKHSTNSKEAREFYEFLQTPKAKEIFKRYGYINP